MGLLRFLFSWMPRFDQDDFAPEPDYLSSSNNSHLEGRNIDRISQLATGQKISFSYRKKRSGDNPPDIQQYQEVEVYSFFRAHTFPYVAFSGVNLLGGYTVKRLDRMYNIVSLETGEVFSCYEDWLQSRGVHFIKRGNADPNSRPAV